MMKTAAIIVGIDDYKQSPLTSAVKDAQEFRKALMRLNLVAPGDITMLTSPRKPTHKHATKKNITDALYSYYQDPDLTSRLYFFFAGHGLLTFSDVAQARTRTVLVPVDVKDLATDGNSLLDLNELCEYMRLRGPEEQFYFIDACRDLDFQMHPSVGTLGWSGLQLSAARKQAILYAVSELGKAIGQSYGMGVMTNYLIQALEGEGLACDYDDVKGEFVVTAQSLKYHVVDAMDTVLRSQPAYMRNYMIPQLDAPDPQTSPLRVLTQVPDKPLTINIDPDNAAHLTAITISLRGVPLRDNCLPPQQNRVTQSLRPQRYLLEAQSTPPAQVVPPKCIVDVRKDNQVDFQVQLPSLFSGSIHPSLPPDINSASSQHGTPGDAARRIMPGRVLAYALEKDVAIELTGLEHPYEYKTSRRVLDEDVRPGPYRVTFRLGPDVFHSEEIYVKADETCEVRPTISPRPLVREALQVGNSLPQHVLISKSIGPIQSEILQTMLPLIGLKAFDLGDTYAHEFEGLVQKRDPELFGLRAVSVVLAIDGDEWPIPPRELLRRVRCRLIANDGNRQNPNIPPYVGQIELQIEPLSRPNLSYGPTNAQNPGFGRVGLALTTAPSTSFYLDVMVPLPGYPGLRLSCASIPRRATVITVTLQPNGSSEISQNLLRFPDRADLYTREHSPDRPYTRIIRDLQLGYKLYQSHELLPTDLDFSDSIRDLIFAKWTDPILTCMAYYAWQQAVQVGTKILHGIDDNLIDKMTENLSKYFGELPDVKIIQDLVLNKDDQIVALLESGQVPVLAESTRVLAKYAEGHQYVPISAVEFARRMPVDQVWSVNMLPSPSMNRRA